jgi:hypothetical protein
MSEPIEFAEHTRDREEAAEQPDEAPRSPAPVGMPSNAVYARVGDVILRAAQDGVRRGLPPADIVREIVAEHNVRLNVGELRLLLASRRVPPQGGAS